MPSSLLDVVAGGRYSRQISTVTGATSVNGTAGATSLALPWCGAGSVAGNVLTLVSVALKPGTANLGSVATPAGWTLVDNHIGGGYGATLGTDTGNTRIYVFSKAADNTAAGNLTITITPDGASGVASATMGRLEKTTETTWSTIVAVHTDNVVDTTTPNFVPPSLQLGVGDLVYYSWGLAANLTGATALNAGDASLAGPSPSIAIGPFNTNGFHVSCVQSARRSRQGLLLPTYILTCPVNERGPSIAARLRVR